MTKAERIEMMRKRQAYFSDFTEYEQYYIIKSDEGTLTVSDIIMWQDDYCCNSWMNISTGKDADEEDIPRCY